MAECTTTHEEMGLSSCKIIYLGVMMKLGLVLSSPFDSPQQPPKAFSRLDSVVVAVLSFFLHFFLGTLPQCWQQHAPSESGLKEWPTVSHEVGTMHILSKFAI